ncbi:MAG: KH domain-containing protein [bacterium]|nr:KH domain-containing protein [bacterium]
MSEIRDDLAQVLTLLVDEPREVAVSDVSADDGPRLEGRVADGDLGKVIGRQGRTARALRRVLAARSAHGERPWDLKILDN